MPQSIVAITGAITRVQTVATMVIVAERLVENRGIVTSLLGSQDWVRLGDSHKNVWLRDLHRPAAQPQKLIFHLPLMSARRPRT